MQFQLIDEDLIKQMKPSDLLQAMIDGLLENVADERFEIDMATFGTESRKADGGMPKCFACAATCAISKIMGARYADIVFRYRNNTRDSDLRISSMAVSNTDFLWRLERRLDHARRGYVSAVLSFMLEIGAVKRLPDSIKQNHWNGRFRLDNDNWGCQIPKVQEVIEEMQRMRL